MSIARIALIGSPVFFMKTLLDILWESDFKVDLRSPDSINIKETSEYDEYDLVIASLDICDRIGEEAFFTFLLSMPGFLLVDTKADNKESLADSPIHISHLMSPEEIISRVNNIIYKHKNIRKSPRIKVSIEVEYECQGRYCKSRIENLSTKGAFITTLNPPPRNSLVRLLFSLEENNNWIETVGHVIYSIGYNLSHGIISNPGSSDKKIIALPGMGVFFEDISENDRESIGSFIELKTF